VERSYPAHWEADVVLLDGATAHLRPIRPDDADRFRGFFGDLSDRTVYFRYFVPSIVLRPKDIERAVQIDYVDRVTIVGTVSGEIIGIAVYERTSGVDAEVAFTVSDKHQGRGLGSILLEHLAAAARERGIERFVADVLPENERMLAVFDEAGYRPESTLDDGVLRLVVDIEPTGEYYRVLAAREHRAEARSVERVFTPRAIAMIGVSERPGTFGHTMLRNAIDSDFTGEVYVVHPTAESIEGLPAYRSVEDISEPVDLAVISVRAEIVLEVVAACGRKGVGVVVVISAGFAESGDDEGRERQRDLVRIAREHGMRVIGPNCLGVINTDPAYSLNASLAPVMPLHGRIGFFCQSGSLGITLLETVSARNLGVSTFVSAGNRADVSGNDLLQYWDEDPDTDVVLLYLESIGNPRKFTRLARRLARRKPVVAVKSGRSTQASPLGHLTRPTRLPPSAVDELFRQSGVIQTDTVAEMFDVAQLLAFQPLPAGSAVAVLGNSDALRVLAVDALASRGLFAQTVRDLGAGASAQEFEDALSAAIDDPGVDAVLTIFVPPLSTAGDGVPRVLAEAARRSPKPVLATLVGSASTDHLVRRGQSGAAERGSVPAYGTIEEAVRALALVHDYAMWRTRPVGVLARPGLDAAAARLVVDAELRARPDGGELDLATTRALLGAYGIESWGTFSARNEDAAVEAAQQLGFPVALTAVGAQFQGRNDRGNRRDNLESERGVRLAFRSLQRTFGDDATSEVVLQRTPPPGVACSVTAMEDALFGPVIEFGLSGVMPELLGDRGYRIPPFSEIEAIDLISTPKTAPLLFGYQGDEPADVDALADLLVRVAWLAEDLHEVASLVLDPVVVSPTGLTVLSARMTLAPLAEPVTRSVRSIPD
jgi:acyl-CoA synthetase (NDP forming)/RimJ/RimL family protein N-acetyltransferase